MNVDMKHQWERFQRYYHEFPTIGLRTDLSRMLFDEGFFKRMSPRMVRAFDEMDALEGGAIANASENRMVGHYWLRNPALAPTAAIRSEIETTLAKIRSFAEAVHSGKAQGQHGPFSNLLLIGIGGSSLGPQFVAHALGHPRTDRLRTHFFDNTDPDGMERVLANIGDHLGRTLCIVVSKSGATRETRNGMLEAAAAYAAKGLKFDMHAVAITREHSNLHSHAVANRWLETFPMWDWVGGRTSVLSAVGLLPAILQGIDIDQLIAGARACDEITRAKGINCNPSAQLAVVWFHAGAGMGQTNMVLIPYRDKLELLSRYLQQIIMESLGKAIDGTGRAVHQGLSVFGNKGSTDQHSYMQQLMDGSEDAFVVFVEALRSCSKGGTAIEPGLTSEDYLSGFLLGTRQALFERKRESLTLTIERISAFSVGVLIALFERAVGLYASLVGINAYDQPGVEAGKKAADCHLQLQARILGALPTTPTKSLLVDDLAMLSGYASDRTSVFQLCERLVSRGILGVNHDRSGLLCRRKYWRRE